MQILRLRDVIHTTGLGRSSLYKFSRLGKFPSAITIGGMSVGWNATTLNQWIVQRIRDRDQVPSRSNHTTPWAVTITEEDTSEMDLRVLRIRHVMALTGLGRATVYKYIHEREFPLPVSLVGASVGWLQAEIEYWLACRAAESSDESLEEPETQSEAA